MKKMTVFGSIAPLAISFQCGEALAENVELLGLDSIVVETESEREDFGNMDSVNVYLEKIQKEIRRKKANLDRDWQPLTDSSPILKVAMNITNGADRDWLS